MNILVPKIGYFVLTTLRINREQFDRIKKGDKIEIVYLPDNDEKTVLKENIYRMKE